MDADMDRIVRGAIKRLVEEKCKQVEHDVDNCRVSIEVSRRQIGISVYTMKKNDLLPLPLVDEEYATAVYDLKTHRYVHGINADALKTHVMQLYRLYKLGRLNVDMQE